MTPVPEATPRGSDTPGTSVGSLPTSAGTVTWVEYGTGPTVVLLHANPGSADDFSGVIPSLAEHYRVIAVDWPGYGASADLAGDFGGAPSYADVLLELLDHWRASGMPIPVALIGNSVGGYAALVAANRRPDLVSALVLIAPGGFTDLNPATRAFCAAVGNPRIGRWLASPLAHLYLRRRTPASRAHLQTARAVRQHPERIRAFSAVWRSFLNPAHDLRSLPPPHCPILLTWGRFDPVVPAVTDGRRSARVLGTDIHTFATGHMPQAEDPDAWLELALPFLTRCASTLPESSEAHG